MKDEKRTAAARILTVFREILDDIKTDFDPSEKGVAFRAKRRHEWDQLNARTVVRSFYKEVADFYKTAPDEQIQAFEDSFRTQNIHNAEAIIEALHEVRTRHQSGDEIDFLEKLLKLQAEPEAKSKRGQGRA